MLKKLGLVLIAAAVLASVSVAQDHPNFSGTWKLNSAKSNPGDYGPSAQTDEITQDGSKFTIKVAASSQFSDSNYTLQFTTDGKRVTVAPDSPQSNMGALTLEDITASWDGANLVLAMDSNYQGQGEISTKAVYALSADGKTLTIKSQSTTPVGEVDTSLLFDKQ